MSHPASTSIPIITGTDGQPYIAAGAVVALLRALAEACVKIVHTGEIAAHYAEAMRTEADALDVQAIAHTTRS